MGEWIVRLITVLVVAAAFCGSAQAVNWPNRTINLAASQVAQKPVSVHCEASESTWQQMVRATFPSEPTDNILGYTTPGIPTIYVAPAVCHSLHYALAYGPAAVGPLFLSRAIMLLAHEGAHQRGIRDEAVAQCIGMKNVRALAIKYFRVPAKVSVRRIVRVAGTLRTKTFLVPNPFLNRLRTFAERWEAQMPGPYQGGFC